MSRGPARLLLESAARQAGLGPSWRGLGVAGAVAAVALVAGCPKKSSLSDEDPSVRAVRTQFAYIETQVRVFAADNRRAPTPEEGLAVLFEGAVPQDPWGNPVIYEVPGPNNLAFDLVSYGADGVPGGKKENTDLRWSEMK